MEQLQHFTHEHPLSLVYLQPNHNHEDSDDEDEDDFFVEDRHGGECRMCVEQIYSFHGSYYECKDCDYSLHKFCAQLPTTQQNHPLHQQGHELMLSTGRPGSNSEFRCYVCYYFCSNFDQYNCSICNFDMDIICATMSERKIDHPSHPHQLERMFNSMVSTCHACGTSKEGIFYHCMTCPWFSIHQDCALLPAKLLIQQATSENFSHPHPLTLAYSFPKLDQEDKFYPDCRVCLCSFYEYLWLYKCDKCRYYAHVNCASSREEAFMSILLPAGLGRTVKNFKDEDYTNLLHCPFPDESYNLLKHHFFNQKDFKYHENNGEMLNHSSHQHPLILFNAQTSLLHNPMKKIQLLCDGCLKPITTAPFYKCSREAQRCGFVLHEWCARLPSEIQDHPGHPKHTLVLLPNIPSMFFGVFECNMCNLPSNGFAYGCTICEYYVDINCGFIPENITHEAHPNHLLSRINVSATLSKESYCDSCWYLMEQPLGFHCPSCDFFLHIECALLLPRMIRHKCDQHPLSLRYSPVENHIGEYFCEICEAKFDPKEWFYHCTTCAQSMHPDCAPLILQYERAISSRYKRHIFKFLNVKFGGTLQIKGHPHHLSFVQGMEGDGLCAECWQELQFNMIFKCFTCKFGIHHDCASFVNNLSRSIV